MKQVDVNGSYQYSSIQTVTFDAVPVSFSLHQNYPNPFNPRTTISFTVPYKSNVKLMIYNSIGQKLVDLVDKELEAGTHQLTWNANDFPSGIYFYKIEAGDFSCVKKMVLIR